MPNSIDRFVRDLSAQEIPPLCIAAGLGVSAILILTVIIWQCIRGGEVFGAQRYRAERAQQEASRGR